jgi:predicted amidohydrolase YtcJ
VRLEGPKWVLDGTPLEMNACSAIPYPERLAGVDARTTATDQLRAILRRALTSPRQLALHVVGDAQTDRLLTLMQDVAQPQTWKDKRVRIEHGDGIRSDTLARVAQFGLVVVQNPTHFPPPAMASTAPSRPHAMLASLARGGVTLALGSDGGPDEMNPFLNIMLASTYAAAPQEALSREEALLAYTAAGAHAERSERTKGRLAPGFAANLAVLSQDILKVPAPAIPATRSVLTMIDGVVVHEEPDWGR